MILTRPDPVPNSARVVDYTGRRSADVPAVKYSHPRGGEWEGYSIIANLAEPGELLRLRIHFGRKRFAKATACVYRHDSTANGASGSGWSTAESMAVRAANEAFARAGIALACPIRSDDDIVAALFAYADAIGEHDAIVLKYTNT